MGLSLQETINIINSISAASYPPATALSLASVKDSISIAKGYRTITLPADPCWCNGQDCAHYRCGTCNSDSGYFISGVTCSSHAAHPMPGSFNLSLQEEKTLASTILSAATCISNNITSCNCVTRGCDCDNRSTTFCPYNCNCEARTLCFCNGRCSCNTNTSYS